MELEQEYIEYRGINSKKQKEAKRNKSRKEIPYNDAVSLYGLQSKDGNILIDDIEQKDFRKLLGIKTYINLDAWIMRHPIWNGYLITEKNKYRSHEFGQELNNQQYRFFVREDGVCYKIDKRTRRKYEVELLNDGKHLYPGISSKTNECKKYPIDELIEKHFKKYENQ